MKMETVLRSEINSRSRLDASFYLSKGNAAARLIKNISKQGNQSISLGDKSIGKVWQPGRNVLVYSADGEEFIPYLQPYDILEFLPEERSRLSVNRNDINDLRIHSGTILQTCSGRNLGPLVIADDYLQQFLFGSDLIRIDVYEPKIKYYIFAFLNTWAGQALLHYNKTGSVIDHLSIEDVENIKIPLFNDDIVTNVSRASEHAFELVSQARRELAHYKSSFIIKTKINKKQMRLCTGWGIKSSQLHNKMRIDAAYYDPTVKDAAEELKDAGGIALHNVAKVIKPAGRYKTNYVDEGNGLPILSGRQLLQNQNVGLKYISKHTWTDYSNYQLREGWIAYPADGRAEGRLGTPVLTTASRDGWCASGHIGRLKPLDGTNPGYLFLAMSHPAVQAQLLALSCGSVVDAIYPGDIENIILPAPCDFPFDEVVRSWNKFDEAKESKQKAIDILCSQLHA